MITPTPFTRYEEPSIAVIIVALAVWLYLWRKQDRLESIKNAFMQIIIKIALKPKIFVPLVLVIIVVVASLLVALFGEVEKPFNAFCILAGIACWAGIAAEYRRGGEFGGDYSIAKILILAVSMLGLITLGIKW